ncbi:MAG: c-type cytochrome [Candidatus Hydrogenedentes bacterium]|nr:c-type cytochrome [Candidatus Hydrogenedentota bacterium]
MRFGCRPLSFLLALAAFAGAASAPAQFHFEPGDHIAFLGNNLADRMQHHGWLESYLHSANPDKSLVIRNLGFSGDQVALRPRNENFPSQDFYLRHIGADVIFVFFGYNESYSRDPEKFKSELRAFIDELQANQYNGESAPRIVLFSPIAHENLESPNLPDGNENNLWLSIYTDAMARVAAEKGVGFVDIFAPSRDLYAQSGAPLTINGVHPNSDGNRAIARAILAGLGQPVVEDHIDTIRAAVLEKNWCWFNRYRATDGNDVWGSRSTLTFVDDQTNAEVLQHELVMLDVMTANRDQVVWSAIRGESVPPDDSNVPDPVQVITNFDSRPNGGNGSLDFVPAEKGVETLTLAPGMKANLFASEAQFPELVNPVQMDVDPQGRIWVAAWQTYPKWQPDQPMLDQLLILPDDNRDGVADRAITFDYVHNPTAFTFWNGGVIVASAPNIWFLKDTDGDDKADHREILFSGIDSADTHHAANNFDDGPDGYVYYQRGVFHVSNVETPWSVAHLSGKTGMYRFNPRTFRFAFHADNSPNPHGGDFDYWGYQFATDATSGRAFQVRMDGGGGYEMHELLEKTVRPVPSSGILSSQHFPEENNGNYIILNSIGFLGIKQYTLEYKEDGTVWGTETDDLLVSSDGNFRPADFAIGEDGALYVADWANPLIGHMQHNIRDPSRDHKHGRVYRITVEGRPLEDPAKIHGEPIPALLDVLKHPTNSVRVRARAELSAHPTEAVIAAAAEWIKQFDGTKADDAHHLLEALWLHQQHNVVNEGLLTVLLHSPERHARHAAQRVKYQWEIDGMLGRNDVVDMSHHAHMDHSAEDAVRASQDFRRQAPSPNPKMDGDTLVIHIQTLKEQMKYDRSAFAVGPGMKVRLVFKNPDAMDHNLIMVQPGATAEVAMAAMMLGAEGIAKGWTPESNKILFASEMLSIGEEETIEFVAPTEKAIYEYLCTYPGHWTLMNGKMHVVDDPLKWMADNKATTVTTGGARVFVKEWTAAELKGALGGLDSGRDLVRGKRIFEEASCNQCHQTGEGDALVGPDLAGVRDRLDPAALLVEILEPSHVINDAYKSWQIEIETDDLLAETSMVGLIAEETDEYVRIVANPLQDAEGVKIPKDQVGERTASPLSAMPTGLLNSYQRGEILDLMAYLQSLKAAE